MTSKRLGEILFFFRANALALLWVTLPFAAAATFTVQLFGEPLVMGKDGQPATVEWRSALLLCLLYPLGLGVKTLAIHRLAGEQALSAVEMVGRALRLWPTLALLSLLVGLFVMSGVVMGLAVGSAVMESAGLLNGPASGLLVAFMLPGLWLYMRVGAASIIAVTEDLSPVMAMGEAWQRSRDMQMEMFTTLLALVSALLLVLLLLFGLLDISATGASAAADLLARAVGEWLFCLLTIAFYRFWSLAPRGP